MFELLIYAIIILGFAAIWQLVRVVELSARLKGVDPNKVTESDNRLNGRLMLTFMIAMFAFSIWQFFAYKDRLLPTSGSAHGEEIDWLWDFNMIIVVIVFFITNGVLFYMAYKYYGRDNARATFYPHNNKLEMLWTGVPAVVLFIIIFLGIKLWNNITEPAPASTRLIELYAKQFSWTARYAGEDNKLGKANYLLIQGANELGLDSTDKASNDDIIVKGEFHIPVDQEVNFRNRSQDVIHSMFMPHFRAQINTVPGMETYFHFKPIHTTEAMRKITGNPNFDYILMCNKICGASHYNMQMKIVVETKEEYEAWIKTQKTFIPKVEEAKADAKPEADTAKADSLKKP
ncbi:MAG: cytochrome c oxidase subunit II [Bacteroidia bacterium]